MTSEWRPGGQGGLLFSGDRVSVQEDEEALEVVALAVAP